MKKERLVEIIKINFPIKSSLGIGIVCVAVAVIFQSMGVSLIVSFIFLSFAIYYFVKWYKSLKFISANEAIENIKQLERSSQKKYIGGVCYAVNKRYNIPVFLVRILFIVLSFFGLIGVFLYLIIWKLLPSESIVKAQTKHDRKTADNRVARLVSCI